MMSTDITIDPNSPHVKFSDLGIKPTPVEKVRTLLFVCLFCMGLIERPGLFLFSGLDLRRCHRLTPLTFPPYLAH